MELALYANTITVDYDIWRQRRVKSQITPLIDEACQNPFSEEIPSELEIARHEFEREKAKLLTEKVQKEVEITRKDLRDLHLENKKLRGTIRNSGLGKSSAEWKEELSNVKGGMEFWKAKEKKKEERVARAMIDLRKKHVEYETVSTELTAS
ncbi:hypothetical protein Gotur_025380 [Gossypium turneri]